MNTIIGAIIAFVLSSIAHLLINTKYTRTMKTMAVVQNSECVVNKTTDAKGNIRYYKICNLSILYDINGTKYDNTLTTDLEFSPKSLIEINYDPNNPKDISYKETPPAIIGYFLLFIGIILFVVGGIYYYFVSKYEPVAALEGTRTTISTVKKAFD